MENVNEGKPYDQQIHRLASDWIHPEVPPAAQWQSNEYNIVDDDINTGIEFEWAGRTIKSIGTVVHRYIQMIAEDGLELWNEAHIKSKQVCYEKALAALGVQNDEIFLSGQQVIEALTRIIQDKRGQWILDNNYTIQNNEYWVSGLFEKKLTNIIIDRTFVDNNNVRWIIDYKTSRHKGTDIDRFLDQEQERYKGQLEKYGNLMSQMDERKIKLGLYFPLLQGWREWNF